jgi:hypothetical protein
MEKIQMVVRKRVEGQIEYNDGEFAEIQTVGIEGIEEDLLLETIQLHRGDTHDTPEEFQHRFPVGVWLCILTTTEVTKKRLPRTLHANSGLPVSPELRSSVRSQLEAALRAQRKSWDAASRIEDITGYDGDIYAFVAELAGGFKDDEAIPDDLVDDLISSPSMSKLPQGSSSQKRSKRVN